MTVTLGQLLKALVDSGGSDLHIGAGMVPCVRVGGKLHGVPGEPSSINNTEIQTMVFSLLTPLQQNLLQEKNELDLSFGVEGVGRFRCNIHRQRSTWAAAFRRIPNRVPTLQELGLPDIARTLALKESGLLLISGPTGTGKSMTLAAMIETINAERANHIITIEDPIEFLFTNKKSVIKQREIGTDTASFESALAHIFRQDPDVIVIGEIRTPETITQAIASASTGRLVIGTMHTMDAVATIERLVESFPADQQNLMRTQIAGCLEGIVSQQLVKRVQGPHRALAPEIMISTPTIRNLIRAGKTANLTAEIESGKRIGMQSMNQSLHALIVAGAVKLEEALQHTRHPEALFQLAGIPK